jgi:hypothetical protein
MHTERRLTSLFDNVTDSDDSDTNDQSMHTERQLSSWNDIKLCADKPMIMQPPRTCPLNDENTDTTNEDSEVHAIIPVETKRTRKRRKRTQRAHSRQLPPAPRCHQNCKTNCRTVEHYREDANDMTVVSACRTSNCACNISADLAPSRPGVLIVTADCCLLVM